MLSSGIHKRLIGSLGVLAGLLLAAVAATPALAHDELLGAEPGIDAVVQALPAELELTFSGVLLDGEGTTEIVVTDAGGADLTDGAPVLDGVRVRQALTGPATGLVSVKWRVVSSDGHPVSGGYTFTVGDRAATTDPLPGPPMEATDMTGWLWAGGVAAVAAIAVVIAIALSRRGPSRED